MNCKGSSHNNTNRAVDQIPLNCNVCPKKPTFSDLSHLLTHVASKGHLSNHFKMGINARQDPTAHQIYTEYEKWEQTHGIQDLMRDRLNQKEKKKGTAAAASRRSSATHASSQRSTPSVNIPASSRGRVNNLREEALDPMLDRRIKNEPYSRPTTPLPPYGNPYDLAHLHHRSYAPPMQSWSASPYNLTQDNVKQEPDVELLSSDSFDPDPRPSRDPVRRSNRVRASASNLPIIINEEEYENDEDVNNEKLKGIVWPGMSLWDSATPEMQRKRNQKKAVSVVLNLERTSTQVEPFELIFDQAGEFRKKRNINDEPDSDDSLIKGESSPEPPTKKRAVRRPRRPMGERDPNTSRRTSRRQHDTHYTAFGNRNNPYYLHGEEEDDTLTYGTQPGERKGLSIHCDNTGPEITFDNPASLDTLASSFRHSNESFQSQPTSTLPSLYRDDSVGFMQRPTILAGHQNVPSVPGMFRPAQTDYPQNAGDYTPYGQMNGQAYQQTAETRLPSHGYDSFGLPQQYNFNPGYNFYGGHEQSGMAAAATNFTGYDMLGAAQTTIKPEQMSPVNNHQHSNVGEYMTSCDGRLADFFGVGGNPLFLSSGNHGNSPNNEANDDDDGPIPYTWSPYPPIKPSSRSNISTSHRSPYLEPPRSDANTGNTSADLTVVPIERDNAVAPGYQGSFSPFRVSSSTGGGDSIAPIVGNPTLERDIVAALSCHPPLQASSSNDDDASADPTVLNRSSCELQATASPNHQTSSPVPQQFLISDSTSSTATEAADRATPECSAVFHQSPHPPHQPFPTSSIGNTSADLTVITQECDAASAPPSESTYPQLQQTSNGGARDDVTAPAVINGSITERGAASGLVYQLRDSTLQHYCTCSVGAPSIVFTAVTATSNESPHPLLQQPSITSIGDVSAAPVAFNGLSSERDVPGGPAYESPNSPFLYYSTGSTGIVSAGPLVVRPERHTAASPFSESQRPALQQYPIGNTGDLTNITPERHAATFPTHHHSIGRVGKPPTSLTAVDTPTPERDSAASSSHLRSTYRAEISSITLSAGNSSTPEGDSAVALFLSPSLPPPDPDYTLRSQPDIEVQDLERSSYFVN